MPEAEWIAGSGVAVVLAGVLVKFLLDLARSQQALITNHIHANTEALVKLAEAIRELREFMQREGR